MNLPDEPAPWTDEPTGHDAPDIFGRGTFVQSVVARIAETPPTSASTVFGLVGPWGSGKTSLLNRIQAGLSDNWHVTEFSPWSAADPAAMGLEFSRVLAKVHGKRLSRDLRRKIAGYGQYLTPLAQALPTFGGVIGGIANMALRRLAERPPWNEQFQELAAAIAQDDKRVLIVVDDVDRLMEDELLALLRVIRLLGRFDNVHYLIAYDQSTVEMLLNTAGYTDRAGSFMEKIVQYPFEIPPLSQASAIRMLNETLRDLLTAADIALDETSTNRASELIAGLSPLVKTPRSMNRFRSQLLAFAGHVHHAEIDVLDYVAITWVRLEYHELWMKLPHWKTELTSGKDRGDSVGNPREVEWARLVGRALPTSEVDAALACLGFLVPWVTPYGSSSFVEHDRAFASPEFFMRYFLLTIAEGDVSDGLIARGLDTLIGAANYPSSKEAVEEELFSPEPDKAALAMAKAIAHRQDASSTSIALLEMLGRRFKTFGAENSAFDTALSDLSRWIPLEVGIALSTGAATAGDIIRIFGDEQSLSLVLRATKLPRFRAMGRVLPEGFVDYWLREIESNFNLLVKRGGLLGGVINLLLWVKGAPFTAGLLDKKVEDLSAYLDIADSFVRVEQWVGREVSWALNFRTEEFTNAVSKVIRDRFDSDLPKPPLDSFEIEDLTSPALPFDLRRSFAIRCLHSIHNDEAIA